ncbi:cell division protein FtsQ [Nocardioides sp. CPCC 206347]|uniref:cell division protein FtsQ n=1 Tax=Nocardioides sp. CPCC 206347 TaxID=3406463 RepID=UPI003B431141
MLTVRRTPRTRVAVPATIGSLESVAALALAHMAAGGEVPGALWLTAFGGLVYAASVVVLRRKAGIRVVLPVLVGAQVLGHAWLVALSPGAHATHGHDAGFLGLTPGMLAAHALAAAVTGLMWAVRRRAVVVLLAWSDLGRLPAPVRTAVPGRQAVTTLVSRRFLAIAPTRGPPAGAAAIA